MCFSAQASFASAGVITMIGLINLIKLKNAHLYPLALIPFLFAAQQMLEGIVWMTYNRAHFELLLQLASYGYLIAAGVIWPILIPYSIYYPEKNKAKKSQILFFTIIGFIIGLISASDLIIHPISVHVSCDHLSYSGYFNFMSENQEISTVKVLMFTLFALATIVPLFLSSLAYSKVLAFTFTTGWLISLLFFSLSLVSVWCFFTALASCAIVFITSEN